MKGLYRTPPPPHQPLSIGWGGVGWDGVGYRVDPLCDGLVVQVGSNGAINFFSKDILAKCPMQRSSEIPYCVSRIIFCV